MGYEEYFICKNCGKIWVHDTKRFCITSDDILEEHQLVSLIYNIERCSIANGSLDEVYCRNCDKDIKIYLLQEIETVYPDADPNRIIEEYKHLPNKFFGTSDEFKELTEVNCPKCNDKLELHRHGFTFDDDFYLNCTTYIAYCEECDERYEFHAIRPPLRDYTEEEVIEKIEKARDKKNTLFYLQDEYDSINEHECPCCGNKIPKANSAEKCPKCDGELESTCGILYD